MQRVRATTRVLAMLAALVVCSHVVAADEVPLTSEAYCDLLQRMLKLSELEWKDRVATAETRERNRQQVARNLESTAARMRSVREGEAVVARTMEKSLDSTSAQYRSYRATLLSNFQTSNAVLTRFARANKEALEEYLNENPAVRAETDSIRSRVDALIQRFESLMAQSRAGVQE